ncbi:hypothetical protein ONE63_009676 [Megalurothrips usitatus]|uniref:Uncharacterized protein n=1 Tax=Megalurothrips usitatus TaxID=439358 RepID=A0AAV7XFF5_9NEOP|nr:hypothetical protein ONE63_009676 [Megalurothrips usitatus]
MEGLRYDVRAVLGADLGADMASTTAAAPTAAALLREGVSLMDAVNATAPTAAAGPCHTTHVPAMQEYFGDV